MRTDSLGHQAAALAVVVASEAAHVEGSVLEVVSVAVAVSEVGMVPVGVMEVGMELLLQAVSTTAPLALHRRIHSPTLLPLEESQAS